MKHRIGSVVGIALFLSGAVVAQETRGPDGELVEPLDVYIFARTLGAPLSKAETKSREDELRRAHQRAEKAREALYQQLRSKFGKDLDVWPEEPREAYRIAWEAESMTELELDYHRFGAVVDGKQKDLGDSRDDIVEAIQAKGIAKEQEWISLLEREENARLIVEIVDRASQVWRPEGRSVEDLSQRKRIDSKCSSLTLRTKATMSESVTRSGRKNPIGSWIARPLESCGETTPPGSPAS